MAYKPCLIAGFGSRGTRRGDAGIATPVGALLAPDQRFATQATMAWAYLMKTRIILICFGVIKSGLLARQSLIAFTLFVVTYNGACSSFYTVRGTVTRCDTGQPIGDARVVLELLDTDQNKKKHGATTSDENGRFRVSVNTPPGAETIEDGELSVSAISFDSKKLVVHHSFDEVQSVCLHPDSAKP